MMNPTQTIEIHDMPRCVRTGFTSLAKALPDPSLDNGNIISEVGNPIVMKLPAWGDPFLVYELRKKRNLRLPAHMFGKQKLGNTYSAFLPRIVSAPPIGTHVIVDPIVTPEQADLIRQYRAINAHVIWIVHVPSPIGVGILLEVFAPEIDRDTKTRGVRFKPSGVNTIAFACPWSNDLTFVNQDSARPGQSGGSICIRTVEDNTGETVSTPLKITIYQAVVGVNTVGKVNRGDTGVSIPGLNFSPIVIPEPPATVIEHGDNDPVTTNEVNAEGGAELVEQTTQEGAAADLVIETEKPAAPVKKPEARGNNKQQATAAARWYEADLVTLNSDTLLEWKNITLDPTKFSRRGENISKAYFRNVWFCGHMQKGYATTLRTKWVPARPPTISGVVEIQDSRNDSSRYLVEFGGNVELDLIPDVHASLTAPARPRYFNNRWARTTEAKCQARYRLTGFNRTSDTADIKLRILVRAGGAIFDVPTKPRPEVSPAVAWLVKFFEDWTEQKDLQVLLDMSVHEHGLDDDDLGDGDYFAPKASNTDYEGEINSGEALDEDLEQDDYPVQVWEGNLPNNGSIVTVPLNLSVAEDLSGNGGISTIAQKFERSAHIVPTEAGDMGPRLGNYVIEIRLPTNIAGNISHVSLPGDMSDEAVALSFGLGDILSMATSALQAVGGPAVSGGIAAGRAIFNVVKAIGGKLVNKSKSDSAEQPMLAGPIDVSRFINFIKPIVQNETLDPTFGSVLMQARDFIGSSGDPITEIPARLWAQMSSRVERQLFDRTITPIGSLENEIYLPYDRYSYILERFGAHPKTFVEGTHQNVCWKKFLTVLKKKAAKRDVMSLKLSEILTYELTDQDEQDLRDIISGKQFVFEP